ncbi:ABC transporter ATP-binding protein [Streptomyces fulvoviolaceus]|uniref:ABC transporter ATP-binding protein n=1 Tax=Streptomyces fulvoviolaceus TaxID=285535 RepID=UPI0021BFBD64|nr:ABC transporter ATP-binding protein [Streptomyces fulvoviolaceus]MCT9079963.1 ABC transporter ATP-binding protein [Streptomyces fulvoviolaceus]
MNDEQAPARTAAEPVPVLEAVDVTVRYPVHRARGESVHALENASLRLIPGRTVALVGESGSGKSTFARTLALAQTPTSGSVLLNGKPASARGRRARRAYARRVQMVLQDPFASLNPLHRVRYLLERPLRLHGSVTGGEDMERRLRVLLERVRLTPPERFLDAFPHELSGGQRQRVAIARALAVEPEVLLGDELVSMLDVSIRLEILNLLAALRDEEHLAMLYITHDIAGARYFADEIAVMYAGEIVEYGSAEDVTQTPAHPYTRLLLDSTPDPDRMEFLAGRTNREDGEPDAATDDYGEPPDLVHPPSGCRFHPRCPLARAACRTESPPHVQVTDRHWARCVLLVEPGDGASRDTTTAEVTQ